MGPQSVRTQGLGGASSTLNALVVADGSASHRYLSCLNSGLSPLRDLSDFAHQTALLHARYPSVLEQAAEHSRQPIAAKWLEQAASGFTTEREYLARIVAASGPLPSTPGQAASEAAMAAQRRALDMLAQSSRVGCAEGTAVALVLDWPNFRAIIDLTAKRLGLNTPPCVLPNREETAQVIELITASMAVERAVMFGAQQLLAQHRGLIDLLEARASARGTD